MGEYIAEDALSANLPGLPHPWLHPILARIPPVQVCHSSHEPADGSLWPSAAAPMQPQLNGPNGPRSPSPVAIMLQAAILYEIFGSHL